MIARPETGAPRQCSERWLNVLVAALLVVGSSTIRASSTSSRLDVTVTVVRSCSISVGSDNPVKGPVTLTCAKGSSVVPPPALSGSPQSATGQRNWVALSGLPENATWLRDARILIRDVSRRADGPSALVALSSDLPAPLLIIDF